MIPFHFYNTIFFMSSPIISQDSNIQINQSLPQRIAIYVIRNLRSNITKQQLKSYVKRNATQRGIVVVSMLSVRAVDH